MSHVFLHPDHANTFQEWSRESYTDWLARYCAWRAIPWYKRLLTEHPASGKRWRLT